MRGETDPCAPESNCESPETVLSNEREVVSVDGGPPTIVQGVSGTLDRLRRGPRRGPRPHTSGQRPGGAWRPLAHHPPTVSSGGPPPWAVTLMRMRPARRIGTLILACMVLALIAGVSGVKVARQQVGYVGVVRNGGPLDNRTIRQVLLPGQRLTWIGLFSSAPHEYPAANVNRTYTLTSAPARGGQSGVDVLTVPTKDGVQVGVDATVFMHFVGQSDIPLLERFDVSVGSRTFLTHDGRRLYPYQGDDGFNAMLDAVFRPVLDFDVRKEIGHFECAELVASCSLVSQGAGARPVPLANADDIARRISTALERDLDRTIGHPYFRDIRVRIARVVLPAPVQTAIDHAQAQFASVNAARAELQQARYQAKKNRLLGATYNNSPALAAIDELKAIPKGSTVIVSAGGRSPTVLAGGAGGAAAVGGAAAATTDAGGN
jgi:SPFH domain / Band 7 family